MLAAWRWVFIALGIACMTMLVAVHWQQIRQLEWDLRPELMLLAMIGLVLLFFVDALGWHLILRSLGVRIGPRANIRIWLLSSLGRYIPGAIWAYVGRVAMCAEQGIPPRVTVLGLYLETVMLCAGALTAGLPALVLATDLAFEPVLAVLGAGLLLLMVHPRVAGLLRHLPGKIGRAFAATELPRAARMYGLYFYYVGMWVAFGMVFVVFVAALQTIPAGAVLPIGASMGLSFALGFIAVFAPGGIGVRESALYLLLIPYLPAPACAVIAIGSRLWIMVGEVLSVALTLTLFAPRSGATHN